MSLVCPSSRESQRRPYIQVDLAIHLGLDLLVFRRNPLNLGVLVGPVAPAVLEDLMGPLSHLDKLVILDILEVQVHLSDQEVLESLAHPEDHRNLSLPVCLLGQEVLEDPVKLWLRAGQDIRSHLSVLASRYSPDLQEGLAYLLVHWILVGQGDPESLVALLAHAQVSQRLLLNL